MKVKIVFSLLALICLSVLSYVLNTVQPEVATSLALEQFKDPTIATDTAIRAYNNAQVFWYMCAGWVALNLFMFYPNVKEAVTNA